ncbi:preprotein translocase subunit YajC [Corynebacterium sp. Q4381]|uniref:preprotein translocase subunit YajC n=1 Tax=Corynebacterium sp. Marseille-Q4381 TaxID=3121597 RepID=UPI002FE5B5AF
MELLTMLLILGLFVLPPLLLMRSQRKRAQEVQQMRASIVPGDAIVTVAGVHGTVVGVDGEVFQVEIAPGVVVAMDSAGVLKRDSVAASADPVEGAKEGPAEAAGQA